MTCAKGASCAWRGRRSDNRKNQLFQRGYRCAGLLSKWRENMSDASDELKWRGDKKCQAHRYGCRGAYAVNTYSSYLIGDKVPPLPPASASSTSVIVGSQ